MRFAPLLILLGLALWYGPGPKQGDVYEEMRTGERVTVGCVGRARVCMQMYREDVRLLVQRGVEMRDAIALVGAPILVGGDSLVRAVTVIKEAQGVRSVYITPRLEFDENYEPIR